MSEFHWEIGIYNSIECSLPLTEGDLTKAADYWDGTDVQYDEITESVTLTIPCPIPYPEDATDWIAENTTQAELDRYEADLRREAETFAEECPV